MTIKKRHTVRKFDEGDASKVDEDFTRVYAYKMESFHKRTGSGVESFIYQAMETGEVTFSATGSPTVARTFALAEAHGHIVAAWAHARSILVTAHVTDVTGTSVTVECRTVSGTGNFSAVTTASVSVYFGVIGSSP